MNFNPGDQVMHCTMAWSGDPAGGASLIRPENPVLCNPGRDMTFGSRQTTIWRAVFGLRLRLPSLRGCSEFYPVPEKPLPIDSRNGGSVSELLKDGRAESLCA